MRVEKGGFVKLAAGIDDGFGCDAGQLFLGSELCLFIENNGVFFQIGDIDSAGFVTSSDSDG